MSLQIFFCIGGGVYLPSADLVLVDREDGGNLIVNPPRDVWERCELSADELCNWSFLVAATGAAMLSTLPQLAGGCINYWEAGNWALNTLAPPAGEKRARTHRSVHMHLLGRSVSSKSENWRWGEAPIFPLYKNRIQWAAKHRLLNVLEAQTVVRAIEHILRERYMISPQDIEPTLICGVCSHPYPKSKKDCHNPNCQGRSDG